ETCKLDPSFDHEFRKAFAFSSGFMPGTSALLEFRTECCKLDMVVIIREKEEPSPKFVRHGKDLIYTANVSLVDYYAGCTLSIPTLEDQPEELNLKENQKNDMYYRIAGKGLPDYRNPSIRGDILVLVKFEEK